MTEPRRTGGPARVVITSDGVRTWERPAPPDHIEDELKALWCEVAQSLRSVARARMSNLIVYTNRAQAVEQATDAAGSERLVVEASAVSRAHPSRLIIVSHELAPGAGHLESEIAIHVYGGTGARFGVEQITLRLTSELAGLTAVLRRLLLGDLPTSIWWPAATAPGLEIVRSLMPLARQFIYDSSAWPRPLAALQTIATLFTACDDRLDLADLAWRRFESLRLALVQAVDPALVPEGIGEIRRAAIEHAPDEASMAWLLAGWLGERLRWQPRRFESTVNRATISFAAGAGTARIDISPVERDEIVAIAIETDRSEKSPTLRITMHSDCVSVRYGLAVTPCTMLARQRPRHEMLAAELRSLHCDTLLQRAVALLAKIPA